MNGPLRLPSLAIAKHSVNPVRSTGPFQLCFAHCQLKMLRSPLYHGFPPASFKQPSAKVSTLAQCQTNLAGKYSYTNSRVKTMNRAGVSLRNSSASLTCNSSLKSDVGIHASSLWTATLPAREICPK